MRSRRSGRAREVLLFSGAGAEMETGGRSCAKLPPVRLLRIMSAISRTGKPLPFGWSAKRRNAEALVHAVESACAAQWHVRVAADVAPTMCRNSRPRTANRKLEKRLKLKEAKRDLKQLKQEKQAMRKSPNASWPV